MAKEFVIYGTKDHDSADYDCLVCFDAQPREKASLTYQGCPARITLNNVIDRETGRDLLPEMHRNDVTHVHDQAWNFIFDNGVED
jgi:hypothetical protein